MRVLIVEDDPSLVVALTLVLEQAGHSVLHRDTVQDGRVLTTLGDVDAVLIDAGVRGGGRGFWEELEASGRYGGRVLLLTGDPGGLGALFGHPRVHAKPFSYQALLAELADIGPLAPDRADRKGSAGS